MSVPSIFSQLYEQADAFSNIVYNDPYGNPIRDSEEERIISLCLDLFELILMKGSEVNVAHIEIADEGAVFAYLAKIRTRKARVITTARLIAVASTTTCREAKHAKHHKQS